MPAKFSIGIDLGTTNSVLAYTRLDHDRKPQVELLPIPQLVAAGTVESRPLLPSFLYLASDQESARRLTICRGPANAISPSANLRADKRAEVPDRTVAAAKSWLCHSRVDRHQPILPWNAPDEVAKSRRRRLAAVSRTSGRGLERRISRRPVAEQHVVLTVPASFDASARELTREAALAAGLPAGICPARRTAGRRLRLARRRRRPLAAACLREGDTLLVCDVGGGTTDLTLVGVAEEDGELMLRRIAVGNHLLVGGDNMDLALAHFVAGTFAEKGVKLDPWQSVALWHSCRAAKESLLAPSGPEDASRSPCSAAAAS